MKIIILASILVAIGLLDAKTPIDFETIEYFAEARDSLKIKEVNLVKSEDLKIGSMIEVIGSYELNSVQGALLGLSITSKEKNSRHFPEAYEQTKIEKGSGEFRLLRKIDRNGGIHVSIYPFGESGRYEQSTSRLYFLELKPDSIQSR